MNNANKPITPIQSMGCPSHESVIRDEYLIGLTKREYFAGKALQGLLSIYDESIAPNSDNVNYMVKLAVSAADELLKVLDETEIKK